MTPEGEIKQAIADYLAVVRRRGFLDFWYTYSTGIYDPVKKFFRKRNSPHDRQGIPDISLIIKRTLTSGRVIGQSGFIEVKTKDGRLTEEQAAFGQSAKTFGAFYIVARSVEDVRVALKAELGIDI